MDLKSFKKELEALLDGYNIERFTHMPAFIVAEYTTEYIKKFLK